MKLMVVDDAIQICSGIRDGIEWSRYGIGEVYAACDGLSALKLFEEHAPEIVIADIRMAGLDGLELSREILRRSAATRVILLSAYSEFEYAREALRMGVFAYELKPLKMEALIRRVREAAESWERLVKKEDAAAQYERICREKELRDILLGGAARGEEAAAFFESRYGLRADQHYLCAVFSEDGAPDGTERLRALLNGAEGVYLSRMEEMHIALFPCANSLLYLEKVVADIRRLIRADPGHPFSCGVSGHGGLQNVAHLLDQAKEALTLRFYTGQNTLNRWSGGSAFRHEAIPPPESAPLDKEKGVTPTWLEVRARVDGLYDAILNSRPFYAPHSVHIYTLELMRGLRQSMRRWLDEEDGEIAGLVYGLESAGVLADFSQYRAAAIAAFKSVYDRYFERGGDALNHFALRCKFYINRYYQKDLRVQEMAEYFGISPNYFSHLFKKTLGVPFKQYLNAVRVRQANILLEQGRMQAAEVAREVGFMDYKYFHQVYRKYMNRAPTQAPGNESK